MKHNEKMRNNTKQYTYDKMKERGLIENGSVINNMFTKSEPSVLNIENGEFKKAKELKIKC